MERAYPSLINQVAANGFTCMPRGTVCQEIRPASFTLLDPDFSLYTGASRRMSFRLAAIEAMMFVSGWDCREAAELITMVAPNTKAFMNERTLRFDGAYGPRLRYGLEQCVQKLTEDPWTRQSVASVWNSGRQAETKDLPCTLSMQFMLSGQRRPDGEDVYGLDMHVAMRSNDLGWGLPNDVAAFCMVLQVIANACGLPTGRYHHTVGSLHYYMQGNHGETEPDLPDTEESWACTVNGPTRLPEMSGSLHDARGPMPITHVQHMFGRTLWSIYEQRRSGLKWADVICPDVEDDVWMKGVMDMVRFSWPRR